MCFSVESLDSPDLLNYIMIEDKRANRDFGVEQFHVILFLFVIEKKTFIKMMAAYYIYEAIFIFSSKDTTSSMVAVTGVSVGWAYGNFWVIILQH